MLMIALSGFGFIDTSDNLATDEVRWRKPSDFALFIGDVKSTSHKQYIGGGGVDIEETPPPNTCTIQAKSYTIQAKSCIIQAKPISLAPTYSFHTPI